LRACWLKTAGSFCFFAAFWARLSENMATIEIETYNVAL
jgi:hypothetical protein